MNGKYSKASIIELYNLYLLLKADNSNEAENVKAEIERKEERSRHISLDQFIEENYRP